MTCSMLAGSQPPLQAYNAVLEAWAAQGNTFETARLYDDMKRHHVQPDICTFIALFEVGAVGIAVTLGHAWELTGH